MAIGNRLNRPQFANLLTAINWGDSMAMLIAVAFAIYFIANCIHRITSHNLAVNPHDMTAKEQFIQHKVCDRCSQFTAT